VKNPTFFSVIGQSMMKTFLNWMDIALASLAFTMFVSSAFMKLSHFIFDMYLSIPFRNQWAIIIIGAYLSLRVMIYAIHSVGEHDDKEKNQMQS